MNAFKQTLYLLLLAGGMFGFGYALVPLYDVFCDITGLNGKTAGKVLYVEDEKAVNRERLVTVEFIANVDRGMPWDFKPMVKSIKVHPGELVDVSFWVRNRSQAAIIGQAVPSVAPGLASNYFHKTECFCFSQQQLAGGKEMQMPLKFYVDSDIPADIKRLTLAYTLFNATPEA